MVWLMSGWIILDNLGDSLSSGLVTCYPGVYDVCVTCCHPGCCRVLNHSGF